MFLFTPISTFVCFCLWVKWQRQRPHQDPYLACLCPPPHLLGTHVLQSFARCPRGTLPASFLARPPPRPWAPFLPPLLSFSSYHIAPPHTLGLSKLFAQTFGWQGFCLRGQCCEWVSVTLRAAFVQARTHHPTTTTGRPVAGALTQCHTSAGSHCYPCWTKIILWNQAVIVLFLVMSWLERKVRILPVNPPRVKSLVLGNSWTWVLCLLW